MNYDFASKCIISTVSFALVSLSFREKYRAERGEVQDRFWNHHHRTFILLSQFSLFFLWIWYCTSTSSPSHSPWSKLEIVSSLCALGGSSLRLWSMYLLQHLFTFEVAIRQNHTLITAGPYKWLRHPSYTGALLGLGGLLRFVGVGSLLLWSIGSVMGLVVVGLRIYNEEHVLQSHFGDAAWNRYCSTRWRLIPFIW